MTIYFLTQTLEQLTNEARNEIPELNSGGCAVFTHKVVRRVMMLYPEFSHKVKICTYSETHDYRKNYGKSFISCGHMWFMVDETPINNKFGTHDRDYHDYAIMNVYDLSFMPTIYNSLRIRHHWNCTYDRRINNRIINRLIDKHLPY